MSKTKEYRGIIDRIKKAVQEEMDHAAHWEVTDWNYEGELYIKSIVARELAELYEIRYEEIKE